MNKHLIVLIIILGFNANAQMSKAVITESLNSIYEKYNKEISVFNDKLRNKYKPKFSKAKTEQEKEALNKEYEKESNLYLPQTKVLQTKKLEELKNLIEKIELSNPMIGKKKIPENSSDIAKNETTDPASDIVQGNSSSKEISDLRKSFVDTFRSDWIDVAEEVLRTDVTLTVDSDGGLKKLIAKGANEEFNYLVLVTLYSLNVKFKPSQSNGYYYLTRYRLPITMNFE